MSHNDGQLTRTDEEKEVEEYKETISVFIDPRQPDDYALKDYPQMIFLLKPLTALQRLEIRKELRNNANGIAHENARDTLLDLLRPETAKKMLSYALAGWRNLDDAECPKWDPTDTDSNIEKLNEPVFLELVGAVLNRNLLTSTQKKSSDSQSKSHAPTTSTVAEETLASA